MIRALYAANRAKEIIGEENLKGYYVWTFPDDFEWSFGVNSQPFGVFSLEKGDIASSPKEGTEPLISIFSSDEDGSKSGKEEE